MPSARTSPRHIFGHGPQNAASRQRTTLELSRKLERWSMPDDATLDRILASIVDRRAVVGALARGAIVCVPGVRVLFHSRGSEPFADFQALLAQVRRVIEAMAWLG